MGSETSPSLRIYFMGSETSPSLRTIFWLKSLYPLQGYNIWGRKRLLHCVANLRKRLLHCVANFWLRNVSFTALQTSDWIVSFTALQTSDWNQYTLCKGNVISKLKRFYVKKNTEAIICFILFYKNTEAIICFILFSRSFVWQLYDIVVRFW